MSIELTFIHAKLWIIVNIYTLDELCYLDITWCLLHL